MKVPGFFPDIPEDPARKAYEEALKQSKMLTGGMSISEFERMKDAENTPWKQLGISETDFKSIRGQLDTQTALTERYGKVPPANRANAQHDDLIERTLESGRHMQAVMAEQRQRRQEERERLELDRRRTEALEQQLAELKASKAEAAREKPIAHSRWRTPLWVSFGSFLLAALVYFLK